MRIRGVTFDAGGTLIDPWPSVGSVYAAVAREFGIACRSEVLTAQFLEAWRKRPRFEYTRADWFSVVQQSFTGICEVSTEFFDAIYERFGDRESWLIYDDVIPTLQKLEELGLKLAVVSNWDDRLPPLLERLGLAVYFDEIIASFNLQAHKPEARIFQEAVTRLGLSPGEVLHVGDSTREDIEGARAAGLEALRIRRSGRTEEYEIDRLAAVIERVTARK